MGTSLALAGYLFFAARAEAFAERKLAQRLKIDKEDEARLDERRGFASRARPDTPLIWFHAASVGESLALLELIRRLIEERPEISVLVTTGTVTSAKVMDSRLPEGAFHQYAPLDALPFVRRFLDFWKPDLAVWTESELWPALITETHTRAIPMLLINARMSKASHDKWRFLRGMARSLLDRFDFAHVQDVTTANYLRNLGLPGQRLEIAGTLKEGAAALPYEEAERERIAARLSGRPVWLAASTHEGEEKKVLEAHNLALRGNPRLLLILVPRHPERGDALADLLQRGDWSYMRRTADELPDADTQVYLADTMGELGLWYRIAPISFVGGSLEPIGGHNPFEPAALGSAILHGPYVTNFVDIYQRLTESRAARLVSAPDSLAVAVNDLMNPDYAAAMANAAWEVSSSGAGVTDMAVDLLLSTLDDAPSRRLPGPT
ncbi:3-deoxy-D-manno-octulosonic acid transferase [Rhodophyticola sp. CCM32]|uniref:3-deoxy-D-manno-octulosonic acid transferase n=1 Tax=Rhodophyticola sp. CCM32 TaxID=2916397 RepID=UPI00107F2F3D|nr:3-deoxy-D-manno-octulosonic acid transferase [Rhodophyticola sp. CCM32]QBY01826.1 3-deoxy-D-manno-octulosonic acid transferase [Rhodophyticola sp. CCM32]